VFRHGIDISRHQNKGVYVCTIGKHRRQSSDSTKVICTLCEGCQEEPDADPSPERGANYCPITLKYQGQTVTLRPWDPYKCVISAAMCRNLIHFPIRPGSGVFAIGCSLQTLSHIADILGPQGRLVGVIDKVHGQWPSSEELRRFWKNHPGVSVVSEDMHSASLGRYECLLGLPLSSKYAFLMGLHDRLGANSVVRQLASSPDPSKCAKHIFSFLEAGHPPDVRCLVVVHWPPNTRVDVIRAVVLTHLDILQRWRAQRKKAEEVEDRKPGAESDSVEGEGDRSDRQNEGENSASAPDTQGESTSKKRPKDDQESPQWVVLDLPTDNLVISNTNADVHNKLMEVADDMKRLRSGLRTGLQAKEQLLLTPYFPNHALLLMKYVANSDSNKKASKRSAAAASQGADGEEAAGPRVQEDRPPSTATMPLPSFGGKFGMKAGPPGASPGLPMPDVPSSGSTATSAAAASRPSHGASVSGAASKATKPGMVLAKAANAAAASAGATSSAGGVPPVALTGGSAASTSSKAASKSKTKGGSDRLLYLDAQGNPQQQPNQHQHQAQQSQQQQQSSQHHKQHPLLRELALSGSVGETGVINLSERGMPDYSALAAASGPGSALASMQAQAFEAFGLPISHLQASQGLGNGASAAMLMQRAKGGASDVGRGAPGLHGRQPYPGTGPPGPVVPGPLGPYGAADAGFGGLDLGGSGAWPPHLGGAGAPPGLWDGFAADTGAPLPGADAPGWRQPGFGHFGGCGKGGGGPGGLGGKGVAGMLGGRGGGGPWRGGAGPGAQSNPASSPPGGASGFPAHLESLQYMPMSF